MARPNPLSLKRPDSVSETRTFTDALQPGIEFSFSFTARARAAFLETRDSKLSELKTRFITGDAENEMPPEDVFLSDGNPALITPEITAIIATLMCLEAAGAEEAKVRGEAHETPYRFDEWVALSECAPSVFESVTEWAQELMLRARGLVSNPTTPGTGAGNSLTMERKSSSDSGSESGITQLS